MSNYNRKQIVFIILHYLALDTTIECIKSITDNIDTDSYKIIIIDNHSMNGTGETLKELYSESELIEVIINDQNLGFARGMNTGIDIARQYYDPDFICCLNNDTKIIQKDFYRKISEEFQRSGSAVIGPQIILKNNSIQKIDDTLHDIQYYKNRLQSATGTKKIKTYIKRILKRILKKILGIERVKKVEKAVSSQGRQTSDEYWKQRHENVVLHGSCLIFTRTFFEKCNGFNDKTFFFVEEELLYLKLKENELLSVYSPEIKIHHEEDVSTDMQYDTAEKKNDFLKENQIRSLKILIKEMERTNIIE